MSNYCNIIISLIILWLYVQTVWEIFFCILCLSIPWLFWYVLIIYILLQFGLRIPAPNESKVKKILGIDPITCIPKEPEESSLYAKDPVTDEQNYTIKLIAHRGAGFDYPENSLTAFRKSFENGCDTVEFDVTLTKDKIPIVFHDDSIDRLSGNSGVIDEMTWDELKDVDISATHALRSKFDQNGEKIPLLTDVIELCLENGQRMFIDIKNNNKEMVKVITETFKKYPKLHEKAVVTSFYPNIIYMIRKRNPMIVGALSWRPNIFAFESYTGIEGPTVARYTNIFKHIVYSLTDIIYEWALMNFVYYILGISCILLHKDTISPHVVRMWRERGIRVFAWTVNLPSEKIHYNKNMKVTYLTDSLLSEKIL